jgi:tagatose 1,6-diphosphate aldolase
MLLDTPSDLYSGPVHLRFEKIVTFKPVGEKVPYYRFKILNRESLDVGHINFRVGDTRHVTLCAGHVGFGVHPEHRGHGYAFHACRALGPFIARHYKQIILTADPENAPSILTIEKLGARFLEEIEVPVDDPTYANGARRKKRYEWTP